MKVIIKAIDLFNKIANGEKLPEKIKFMGDTYYLNEDDLSGRCYFSEKPGFGGITLRFDTSVMNKEVEIIEENKEIEKIDVNHLQTIKKWKRAKILGNKINEIIDHLNKEENNNE